MVIGRIEQGDLVKVKPKYYPFRTDFGLVVGFLGDGRYKAQILWPDNRIETTLVPFITLVNPL